MVFPSDRQPINRIAAVMDHTNRYAFKGQARLAQDAGVSKSAVSRIISGQSSPSFAVMSAITQALEKGLGRSLDPRELISYAGRFSTFSICKLVGCRGCLPAFMFDADGCRKPEYRHVRPGEWSGAVGAPSTEGGKHEKKR